jgi:hypothetical protein
MLLPLLLLRLISTHECHPKLELLSDFSRSSSDRSAPCQPMRVYARDLLNFVYAFSTFSEVDSVKSRLLVFCTLTAMDVAVRQQRTNCYEHCLSVWHE